MARIRAKELCQRLKSEATHKQDASSVNDLRLRILDYFIAADLTDDVFEAVLKALVNDPDPAKQQGRVIYTQILKAWLSRDDDRL